MNPTIKGDPAGDGGADEKDEKSGQDDGNIFERQIDFDDEGDDKNGDDDENEDGDDDDTDAKLERARAKASGKDDDGDDKLSAVTSKIDKLADVLEKQFGKPKADDEDGDPDKPWWKEGSGQKPPSWSAVIKKAKEESKAETMDEFLRLLEKQKKGQDEANAIIDAQLEALESEGLIKGKEQRREILEVASEYEITDLAKAWKIWDRTKANKKSKEEEDENEEQKEKIKQRAEIAGKSNKKQGALIPGRRPAYKQLRAMTMDDVVQNALKKIRR